MAIGGSTHHGFSRESGGCARPVLDDELLAETL